MGVGVHTGNRPAPFVALGPHALPGMTNHIEIISTVAGLEVSYNGKKTRISTFKPLGRGETGLMCYDGPVQVRDFSVEPFSISVIRPAGTRFVGIILPLALLGIVYFSLKRSQSGRLALSWVTTSSFFYAWVMYLAVGFGIGRDSFEFLGVPRCQWFDLALLATFVTALGMAAALRGRLRYPVIVFNFLAAGLVSGLAPAIWDFLPEEHTWKVRFAEKGETPGEILRTHRSDISPGTAATGISGQYICMETGVRRRKNPHAQTARNGTHLSGMRQPGLGLRCGQLSQYLCRTPGTASAESRPAG